MKVFVAGATGAIGTQLVPQLAAAGHDVIAMTRSPAKTDMLRALGAWPVVADALDPDAVAGAVAETEPEVIVHELTALKGDPGLREMRNPDRFAAMTNRLRTEGTDHLLAAGRAVGIRRFIAQSVVAIGTYARTGGPVETEDDPPDLDLPAKLRSGADALRHLEDAVTGIEGAEGIVLRYGAFYGPGTSVSADPEALLTKAIRKRRFPIIGGGGGVWSFVHIEDAASATVAAVDKGGPGIYNVVDDEPAPVREWLPFLAEQLGAKKPTKVPRFVARLLAGKAPVLMMTEVRGASNAKAKRVLGWQPRWSARRGRPCRWPASGPAGSPPPAAIRPATPRWPIRCRWRSSCYSRPSRRSSGRRSCCARCSTTPTTRSPRSWRPASRTPASSWPGPGGTSSSDGPASSRRASNGSAWPRGSSPPPRTATSARSRSCWPTT